MTHVMERDSGSTSSGNEKLDSVVAEFRNNCASVDALLNFDRVVMDFAVQQVESLHVRLLGYGNPQDNGENTLKVLKSVRQNDSLRPKYQVIRQSGVVLLVSYFGSALDDLFRVRLSAVLAGGEVPDRLQNEEVKASFKDLARIRTESDALVDLITAKKDISFQDMQSIVRSFQQYLGIEIEPSPDMDDIIFAQACRHAIVHRGATADSQFLRQLAFAKNRTIARRFEKRDSIQFTNEEVEQVAASMLRFVLAIADQMREAQ